MFLLGRRNGSASGEIQNGPEVPLWEVRSSTWSLLPPAGG